MLLVVVSPFLRDIISILNYKTIFASQRLCGYKLIQTAETQRRKEIDIKMKKLLSILALIGIIFYSCDKTEEVDGIYPEIDLSFDGAFPQNCDTVYRGQSFTVVAKLSDNKELGSYSIDLHHNFDHHNHSTEIEACAMGEDQTAVNPFLYIQSFSVDAGLAEYTTNLEIDIPDDVDTGDYHFMIRVTDKEGWQTLKALSLKIAE